MKELLGEEKAKKVKFPRPFLVIELSYRNKKQPFAVPILTNIKRDYNKLFWFQLPNRLETEVGKRRGLNFASMFPVSYSDIECIRDDDRKIPTNINSRRKLFDSLMLKREDTVPELARVSYNYLREHVAKKGYDSMNADSLNTAYARVQKIIRYETNKVISKGLSVDEFGVRPIISRAQNYLDNHYLKAVSEKESNGYSQTLMPQFYSNINEIYAALEKRESNNKTETVKTSLQSDEKKETNKLTPKQVEIAKNLSDKTGKPVDTVTKVFEHIHSNDIFAKKEAQPNKQKTVVKTQEKNNDKQLATTKQKKKDTDYNCR